MTSLTGMGARAMLRGAVARAITCEFTGAVLDARSAVLIDVWGPTSHSSYVVAPDHYETVRESLRKLGESPGYEVLIVDGRELNR